MKSKIEMVLDAEKKKRSAESQKSKPYSPAGAANDTVESSVTFKDLARAQLETRAMETNGILPALGDKRAITAYKMLRTRVLQRMRTNNWRTLIVTASGVGEGKTVTACNLSMSISNDVNQSVILVDLDLQRPSVASYLGLNVKAGIGDFLSGNAEIKDIVYVPTDIDRLAVIPNDGSVENSSELLTSPRMRELLQWIESQGPNNIAIFDMPPVLACDDVISFLPYVDATLLVAAERNTDRIALSRMMEMLADANLLGVVLNQSREQSSASKSYY
jgi:Mrp family chromosome partitioning ATPase